MPERARGWAMAVGAEQPPSARPSERCEARLQLPRAINLSAGAGPRLYTKNRDFACLLYSKLENKLSVERIHDMMKGAYECESEFVDECLRVELIGMKAQQMKQYVQYCIDHLLNNLGVPELYKVDNPFPWMKLQSMYGKGNFFDGCACHRFISNDGRSVVSASM